MKTIAAKLLQGRKLFLSDLLLGPTKQFVEFLAGAGRLVLLNVVHVVVLLAAESTPTAEAEVVLGLTPVVVAVLYGPGGVGLRLEGEKAVVIAALPKVDADVQDRTEGLEPGSEIRLEGSLLNFPDVNYLALLNGGTVLLLEAAQVGALADAATKKPVATIAAAVATHSVLVSASSIPAVTERI